MHLTTQNNLLLSTWYAKTFDSIVFSIHDDGELPRVPQNVNAYAAILAEHYRPGLPAEVKRAGFQGLTINEEQRAGERFDDTCLPYLGGGFSYRINRRGECLRDKILLPDLSLCEDFSKYF